MNNEKYNQIIHEAYQNYTKEISNIIDGYMCGDILGMQTHIEKMFSNPDELIPLTKEEFINKIKTDDEFSERWGLKIEQRELSLEERHELALPIWKKEYGPLSDMMVPTNVDNTPFKIPTKLITITYKEEKIEVYE